MTIDGMRRDYQVGTLEDGALDGVHPLRVLERWIAEAAEAGSVEPNAMALATVGPDGEPSLRMVLCKGVDLDGVVFYTNFESRKARELDGSQKAAVTFWWDVLERQVRLEGTAERVLDAEADAYFSSRPRGSQVGAWTSPQSAVIASRAELDLKAQQAADRFADVEVIPRPAFWGGYRLRPTRVEFWQGRASRLHDRLVAEREGDGWAVRRLAP